MDTRKLKRYAPKARRDFIAAVTRRAARIGLSKDGATPVQEQGQLVLIQGQAYPKALGRQRQQLVELIQRDGFDAVMEATAYTWFNRLIAIRYMELHGYLDHSYRVLSPAPPAPDHDAAARDTATDGLPEILEQAQHVSLPGLNRERVIELKMDGARDETLYRGLLLAQCRALHQAMPFLFEPLDDHTELLLPDRLLQTDSLIRELVDAIPEPDWQAIEIIGWLYQFYIAEKKDQVIGKVVKSEDIPAATQLFTPNWIVKYMVQNSLGAQWLATYPDSPLKTGMDYYIEPAGQSAEVQAQIAALPPDHLDPETLTLIDPACGSGHILVEAYDLFKAIYLERGYRLRDVPRLILEKNLIGLDIDARAAQLSGFALMMKGRADDRRLFERGVTLDVMALVDSSDFDSGPVARWGNLEEYGLKPLDLIELKTLFEHATSFGSLIQVPEGLAAKLPALKRLGETPGTDLFVRDAIEPLVPLVRQAAILARQYDAVVANPPYMGSKGMNGLLKKFAKSHFPDAKSDLFACFIERAYTLAKDAGTIGMVTMQSWMFLSSFQKMRERMLREKTITTLTQIGYNSFPSMNSKVAQAVIFSLDNRYLPGFTGTFTDLNNAPQAADKHDVFLARDPSNTYFIAADQLMQIPGNPLAYQASEAVRRVFREGKPLRSLAQPLKGMFTGDNEAFVRYFWEVSSIKFGCVDREDSRSSTERWYPYLKGGDFRKWYGNTIHVVNYYTDGAEIKASGKYGERNPDHYFQSCITWSDITSLTTFAARYCEQGFLTSYVGCGIFSDDIDRDYLLGLLCAKPTSLWLQFINPSLHANPGDLEAVPLCENDGSSLQDTVQNNSVDCITIAKNDWNQYEISWDFQSLPLIGPRNQELGASSEKPWPLPPNLYPLTPTPYSLSKSYSAWISQNRDTIAEMQRLEQENNRLFIDAYGLQDELTPNVPIEQITLTVNPAYRYGGKLTEAQQWTRFRQDTMKELVSYAIGCMMGRYRLDRPGLIYAHSGNKDFDVIYNRDQGLGARGQGGEDDSKLSGLDRLAKGDGVGRGGLSDESNISEGGAVRAGQSDSASRRVDSIQYRGGTRAEFQQGVSELPRHRAGLDGGGRDPNTNRSQAGLRNRDTNFDDHGLARRDLPNAGNDQEKANSAPPAPNPSPLTPNPFFPPDDDGIVPLTDSEWFDDDATRRLEEFLSLAWPGDEEVANGDPHLEQSKPAHSTPHSPLHEQNLAFLAANLSPKKTESSRDTIRRYLCERFYKDHLQTYKKRPIYWLFSSGKLRAFQCLVYLHRYNEGTLARMRMEYAVPLQGKLSARIDALNDDIDVAETSGTTAQAKRLRKQRDKRVKQLEELRRYNELLRHYADQRIPLDLDDGVKRNYGKFGPLLAEVRAVTGKAAS